MIKRIDPLKKYGDVLLHQENLNMIVERLNEVIDLLNKKEIKREKN